MKHLSTRVIIGSLLFCVLCFFCLRRVHNSVPGLLEQGMACIAYPLVRVQHAFSGTIVSWREKQTSMQELRDEVTQLRAENAALCTQLVAVQATEAYLRESEPARLFAQRYDHASVHCAQVLSRTLTPHEQSMLVHGGMRHGIKEDMVIVSDGCLVGRITQVYPWYSRAILITDRRCQVAAHGVQSGTQGICTGRNKKTCVAFEHVSHLEQVKEGEQVLSTGHGLVYPQGFLLGTIALCKPGDLEQVIELKPAIDVAQLRHCVILDKAQLA